MNDIPTETEPTLNEQLQGASGLIDIRERTMMLVRSFPCLDRKLQVGWQWDSEQLEKMSRKWSSGERQAVLFVLSVWNPGRWDEKFSFQDFTGTFQGSEEMDAFIDWCRFPWWP